MIELYKTSGQPRPEQAGLSPSGDERAATVVAKAELILTLDGGGTSAKVSAYSVCLRRASRRCGS